MLLRTEEVSIDLSTCTAGSGVSLFIYRISLSILESGRKQGPDQSQYALTHVGSRYIFVKLEHSLKMLNDNKSFPENKG